MRTSGVRGGWPSRGTGSGAGNGLRVRPPGGHVGETVERVKFSVRAKRRIGRT
eukprot:ctg_362.g243